MVLMVVVGAMPLGASSVNSPAIRISFLAGSTAIEETAPLALGSKLVSSVPSALSRAKPLRATPSTVEKLPAIRIWPLHGSITISVTAPSMIGSNEVSTVPLVLSLAR